jgi:hypothetical protein
LPPGQAPDIFAGRYARSAARRRRATAISPDYYHILFLLRLFSLRRQLSLPLYAIFAFAAADYELSLAADIAIFITGHIFFSPRCFSASFSPPLLLIFATFHFQLADACHFPPLLLLLRLFHYCRHAIISLITPRLIADTYCSFHYYY